MIVVHVLVLTRNNVYEERMDIAALESQRVLF